MILLGTKGGVRGAVILEIDDYDVAGFLRVAAEFDPQRFGYVFTPNVDSLIRSFESGSYNTACTHASYVLLDSRVLALLFRLVHKIRCPVCPGSDVTAALFAQVIKPQDRVLLVGSTDRHAQVLRERFGLQQLLHHNPPMGFIHDPVAVEACCQFVESASPFRFCLIAVGEPQGTMLAHSLAVRNKARGLALAIGASIDFITGKQRRAPVWMQRLALEWLYRLLREPRRLARRYLVRGPRLFFYLPRSRVVLRRARLPASGR